MAFASIARVVVEFAPNATGGRDAMERTEFEQRFLALVNQTDIVITAANVSYHLGLSIEQVQEHLLALELDGVIKQETDKKGDAYYRLPARSSPGTLPVLARDLADPAERPGVHDPSKIPPAPVYGSHSAPASGRAVNGLVLNIFVPGVGSFICGRKEAYGIWCLLLAGLLVFAVVPGWMKLWGVLPLATAWIWSIVAGIFLLDQREAPPGQPR